MQQVQAHTHTHTHHRLVGPEGLLLGSQGASLVWWRHFVCSRDRLEQTPEEMPISYAMAWRRGWERDGEREKGRAREGEEGGGLQHEMLNKKKKSVTTKILAIECWFQAWTSVGCVRRSSGTTHFLWTVYARYWHQSVKLSEINPSTDKSN